MLSLDPGILRRRSQLGRKTNVEAVDKVIASFMKGLFSVTKSSDTKQAMESDAASSPTGKGQVVASV